MAGLLDKGILGFSKVLARGLRVGRQKEGGLFLRIGPEAKVFFLLSSVVGVSLIHDVVKQASLLLYISILVATSFKRPVAFYKRVLLPTLLFGGAFTLPAVLNVFVPGSRLVGLFQFKASHTFLGYEIPTDIYVTQEGVLVLARMLLRIFNSLSISLLVAETTSFLELVKGLRTYRLPNAFLMVMLLGYRYIIALSDTVVKMYLARKSRYLGGSLGEERRWVFGRIAYLFERAERRYEELFSAMTARGFCGEVVFYKEGGGVFRGVLVGALLSLPVFVLVITEAGWRI